MTRSILGNRVARYEDDRFLRGAGTYVENLELPNACWLTYVRSTIAHAEIQSIDTTEAAALPGVVAVFTGADLAQLPPTAAAGGAPSEMDRPRIAIDRVRFVGEPVVAIIAEDRYIGTDAADLVVIDYEPLPTLVDVHHAATDAVLLFPDAGTNIALSGASDAPADFSACEVTVSVELAPQRVAAAPMEGRSGAAYWDDDGRLVHYTAAQGTGDVHKALSALYELEADKVRVVVPDMGGGFGAKGRTQGEEEVLGLFAKAVGRPVKWTEDRTENTIAMPHGRGQAAVAKIGGTRDGQVLAYQLDLVQEAGAYPAIGTVLPNLTIMMMSGVYDLTNVGHSWQSVVTNTAPTGAYRGAGRPEAAHAIERAIERFATEIGLDPADVRRKNMVAPFAEPHTTPVGTAFDTGDYPGALDLLLESSAYADLRAEQARRREAGDPKLIGLGLSAYVEITAPFARAESGSVEVAEDGHIVVRTGSTPYGQGHVTTWSMIAAEALGVDPTTVEVLHGDTDEVTSLGVTGGSRSVQLSGTAVRTGATYLIDAARERAAQLLEAAVDDIVFDADEGHFHVTGTPSVAINWADIGAAQEGPDRLQGVSDFTAAMPTFPFGAHLAVVEVDQQTGNATLERFIAVDDAGTIINPLIAEGQRHGGIAQGAAQVLYEEVVYDEDGNPTTTNLADYMAFSPTEMPMFELVDMATPTFVNELGAKGIGESGTIGALPATHNAVIDALSHLGVRDMELPTTPERIWRAIADASS